MAESKANSEANRPPLRDRWLDEPLPARFDPAQPDFEAVMDAHRQAVDGGSSGYMDPVTGLFAMTAVYLRDRGWCCDRGCRHCPYVGALEPGGDHSESEQPDE